MISPFRSVPRPLHLWSTVNSGSCFVVALVVVRRPIIAIILWDLWVWSSFFVCPDSFERDCGSRSNICHACLTQACRFRETHDSQRCNWNMDLPTSNTASDSSLPYLLVGGGLRSMQDEAPRTVYMTTKHPEDCAGKFSHVLSRTPVENLIGLSLQHSTQVKSCQINIGYI